MDDEAATRTAIGVGAATAVIGTALIVAPGRVGAPFGIDDERLLRLIGVADLALAPGLLAGRTRWPWMTARVALNLATAARLAREPSPPAKAIATALIGATAIDGRAAAALHAAGA